MNRNQPQGMASPLMVGPSNQSSGGVNTLNAPPQIQITAISNNWNSGLCDCLDDMPNCLVTWCLPCYTYARNHHYLNKKGIVGPCCVYTCCLCFPCIIGGPFRTNLREKFNITGDSTNDCLLHLCCSACALCQESREISFKELESQEKNIPL